MFELFYFCSILDRCLFIRRHKTFFCQYLCKIFWGKDTHLHVPILYFLLVCINYHLARTDLGIFVVSPYLRDIFRNNGHFIFKFPELSSRF
jgi:hypothetical protein